MTSEADIDVLARRFFDAAEAGDIETLRGCHAPNAIIWHNTDDLEQSRDENARTLEAFVQRIGDRVYAGRRLHVFNGGFVKQHELRGKRADGVADRLTACVICAVDEGRITRLDEYFDSAQVAAFRATAQGLDATKLELRRS
jgi:ketosteroid isomerase-like protein